ncbi:hypothetical protein ACFQ4K_17440 [Tistrella bauzanensis]
MRRAIEGAREGDVGDALKGLLGAARAVAIPTPTAASRPTRWTS